MLHEVKARLGLEPQLKFIVANFDDEDSELVQDFVVGSVHFSLVARNHDSILYSSAREQGVHAIFICLRYTGKSKVCCTFIHEPLRGDDPADILSNFECHLDLKDPAETKNVRRENRNKNIVVFDIQKARQAIVEIKSHVDVLNRLSSAIPNQILLKGYRFEQLPQGEQNDYTSYSEDASGAIVFVSKYKYLDALMTVSPRIDSRYGIFLRGDVVGERKAHFEKRLIVSTLAEIEPVFEKLVFSRINDENLDLYTFSYRFKKPLADSEPEKEDVMIENSEDFMRDLNALLKKYKVKATKK
jgi:hypothetical protein